MKTNITIQCILAFCLLWNTLAAQQTHSARSNLFALDLRDGPPRLELTGETSLDGSPVSYSSTAVQQLYLFENDPAVFRIRYLSPAGMEPMMGYPKLFLQQYDAHSDQFIEVSGGSRAMSRVAGDSPADGLIYENRITLQAGAYRFHFEAIDSAGRSAPILQSLPTSSTNPNLIVWKYQRASSTQYRGIGCVSGNGRSGTAFLIAPGILLTAYHVIANNAGIRKGDIIQGDFSFNYEYEESDRIVQGSYYPTAQGAFQHTYHQAEVVSDISSDIGSFSANRRDWVVLKILDWDNPATLGFLSLDFGAESHAGSVVGFPSLSFTKVGALDHELTHVSVVNQFYPVQPSNFNRHLLQQIFTNQWLPYKVGGGFLGKDDHWLSSQVSFHAGQSGGPLFNEAGEVWAMAVGTTLNLAGDPPLEAGALRLEAIRNELDPWIGENRTMMSGSAKSASVKGAAGDVFSVIPLAVEQLFFGTGYAKRALAALRVSSAVTGPTNGKSAVSTRSASRRDTQRVRTVWFYDLDYGILQSDSVAICEVLGNELIQLQTFYVEGDDDTVGFWAANISGDGDVALMASESEPRERITLGYQIESPRAWCNVLLWDWDSRGFVAQEWREHPREVEFANLRPGVWYQPGVWWPEGDQWLFRGYAQVGIQATAAGQAGAASGVVARLVNPNDTKGRERAHFTFEVAPSNEWCNLGLWDWDRRAWVASQWVYGPSELEVEGFEHGVWYQVGLWGEISQQWLFLAYAQSGVIDSTLGRFPETNTAPTIPGELQVSQLTPNRATVSWQASWDADGDAVYYYLWMQREGGPWVEARVGAHAGTSVELTDLWSDTRYYFSIIPVDARGLSGPARGGEFTTLADSGSQTGDYLVIDLSGGTEAASYPITYLTAVPDGGWTDEYKTDKLVLRRIPAGISTMGSPSKELERDADETLHWVTLTKDFYIGVFELTQRQWELVMGNKPSWFTNATHYATRPVESVSYYDIRENPTNSDDPMVNWPANSVVNASSFMGKLRAKTGLTELDLPTEAQWEYACRAGTTTALNSGVNLTSTEQDPEMAKVGRYYYNHPGGYSSSSSVSTDGGTAKVGSYQPNAWGLYDMHGNVWEWCLDWYTSAYGSGAVSDPPGAVSGTYRVRRGGGWGYLARSCRSASRNNNYPSYRRNYHGFRLARTLP